MDPIALASSPAGGWAVVVAILIAVGLGVVKGFWVPGFVYQREVARADKMAEGLLKNTDALDKLTDALTKRADRVAAALEKAGV